MKNELDVSFVFPIFHNMVSTRFKVKIKIIRSNNRKEYFNKMFSLFLKKIKDYTPIFMY